MEQPSSVSPAAPENTPLKLNAKRTFVIGFAFFGILMLWSVYNTYCPLILTQLLMSALHEGDSTKVQYIVGIIMALDNVFALFMLPLFGHLSDRTHTKIGKRMPYILVGTFVAAVAFPLIPYFFLARSLGGVIAMMGVVIFFMMMYRNPAVALMPDITPKPLRSRANGIINVVGYIGAIIAGGLGIVFSFTDYKSSWIMAIPFAVASLLMIATCLVLFLRIDENRLEKEMGPEMARGEELAAVVDKVEEDKPMSKQNKRMLILIIAAEVLWFMSFNAIETFAQPYGTDYLLCNSKAMTIATTVTTIVSLLSFIPAGFLSEKIGRKWTIVAGLSVIVLALFGACFVFPSSNGSFPIALYFVFGFSGLGWAMVNCCSYPMVVELSSKKTVGKFTGIYYAASMGAQSLTPIAMGAIFYFSGAWSALPIYSASLMAAALVVFLFVKNVITKKEPVKKGLEAFDQD